MPPSETKWAQPPPGVNTNQASIISQPQKMVEGVVGYKDFITGRHGRQIPILSESLIAEMISVLPINDGISKGITVRQIKVKVKGVSHICRELDLSKDRLRVMIEFALSGKSTKGNSKKRFFLYQNGSAFPPYSYVANNAPRSNHNCTVNINEERYACLVDGCSCLFETWGKTLNHMGTCGYNGIRPSKEESEAKSFAILSQKLMSSAPPIEESKSTPQSPQISNNSASSRPITLPIAQVNNVVSPRTLRGGGGKKEKISSQSILRDNFIPAHLKQIIRANVSERWVLCNNDGVRIDDALSNPRNMEPVIEQIAENFIPKVSCYCSADGLVHGPAYYKPNNTHFVPPDLMFALKEEYAASSNQKKWIPYIADLDETTSLAEYSLTFRSALRAEHEELMRLFEKYTQFGVRLLIKKRLVGDTAPRVAHIKLQGISDARPSLVVGDVVLLRPMQPLLAVFRNQWGQPTQSQYNIEIESRIVSIVRGKRQEPDTITINWDLSIQQEEALRDHTFLREYAIRFIPSSMVINRSLTSLDWLEGLSMLGKRTLQAILFPVTAPVVAPLTPKQQIISCGAPTEVDISDISKPLNELQSSFVRMVRARTLDPSFETTRPPMILTGPAGTGKTKTLIYAIADCLGLLPGGMPNNNRVLVCCPSHAASDVLTRRLSGLLKRKELFRLYDASRPSVTVPGSILPFTCQVPGSDCFTLPPPSVWKGLKAVICTCMDAHLLYRAQLTNHAIRAKQQCFKTFLMSGNNPLGLSIGQVIVNENPFFTHLFIDEAAQATEPEILCPISCVVDASGGRKVEIALCGDPRQLSPRVYSSSVADTLGRSFMERLLRRPVTCLGGGESSLLGPSEQSDSLLGNGSGSLTDLIRYYATVDGSEQLTIFLVENYRGHSSFLMMPSSFFYFDRLRSAKVPDLESNSYWCNKLRQVEALSTPLDITIQSPNNSGPGADNMFAHIHRQRTWPIHFRGVKGIDTAATLTNFAGTDSWQNIAEANAVVDIVSALVKDGLDPSRIGCMAPFRGQVVAIRKLLRKKYFHDVNVGTIENYQAVEQDVIILSLTRANHTFIQDDIKRKMGLFGLPKQVNVAMTRAENLFITVGEPNTLWKDTCWRQWLRFTLRNGLWFGEGLEQWKSQDNVISMKEKKYVSTIDLANNVELSQDDSVVVSTMEKIHRLHQA